MRALCVLQISTRLGLFYIWHRLLSGISQLKKKTEKPKIKNPRSEATARVEKENAQYAALLFITKSLARDTCWNVDSMNQGKFVQKKKKEKYCTKRSEKYTLHRVLCMFVLWNGTARDFPTWRRIHWKRNIVWSNMENNGYIFNKNLCLLFANSYHSIIVVVISLSFIVHCNILSLENIALSHPPARYYPDWRFISHDIRPWLTFDLDEKAAYIWRIVRASTVLLRNRSNRLRSNQSPRKLLTNKSNQTEPITVLRMRSVRGEDSRMKCYFRARKINAARQVTWFLLYLDAEKPSYFCDISSK